MVQIPAFCEGLLVYGVELTSPVFRQPADNLCRRSYRMCTANNGSSGALSWVRCNV